MADAPASAGTGFDPIADLFFGMGAICLLAVLMILPTLGFVAVEEQRRARSTAELLAAAEYRIAGAPADALLVGPSGLAVAGADGRLAPDAIADDPGLARRLQAAAAAGRGLVVLIEPGGEDTAFALEPVLARHGPAAIRQVRLDRDCAFARRADLAAACRRAPAPRGAP